MGSSACSQGENASDVSSLPSNVVSESESESSIDQNIIELKAESSVENTHNEYDEYGLPVMSSEDQEMFDKYFLSDCAAITNFQSGFDKGHIEFFCPKPLMPIL